MMKYFKRYNVQTPVLPIAHALLNLSVASYLLQVFFFFWLVFLGLHLWHVAVPNLGVESELQLPAYATAIAMRDWNTVTYSSCQCQILNPLREARD